MKLRFSGKSEFTLGLIVLLSVVAVVQFAGLRAIHRGDISLDLADECAYLTIAQTYYSQSTGTLDYLWEVLHSFKSSLLKFKAPGTQLASTPIVLAQKGVDPTTLRQFSFLWMIPGALLLYCGLCCMLRPAASLLGALFFVLSQAAIMTFSHWYQEMTAIPAVCMAVAFFCYEIKHGGTNKASWFPIGIGLGLGMYSKISYVFIFMWMWLSLFALSMFLPRMAERRRRLLFVGVTAYCVSSFWWPTHFLYVLRYIAGTKEYVAHGAMTGSPIERISLFFKSEYVYMYGPWLTVLFFALVLGAMIVNRTRLNRVVDVVKSDRGAAFFSLLVSGILLSAFLFRWKGMLNHAGVFVLAGLIYGFLSRLHALGVRVMPLRVIGLFVVGFPWLVLSIQRLTGNNFNPRVYSVIIPLTAAVLAFAADEIMLRKNRLSGQATKPLSSAVVLVLLLHACSLAGVRMVGNTTHNHPYLTPFNAKVLPPDYAILPRLKPIPEVGVLKIGFVETGHISPHVLKLAYTPDVYRIDAISLFSRAGKSSMPSVGNLVELALDCDMVVIPSRPTISFPALTAYSVVYMKEKIAFGARLAAALSSDPRFRLLYETQGVPGKHDGMTVYGNTEAGLSKDLPSFHSRDLAVADGSQGLRPESSSSEE